ncbi:liprin-beta-1 [Culicoides brevitarsis]|uniref:liprin-beta-1 n=1 Tax=Culicoides brevitarsis TaxID=469753 RepID=UPI00307CA2B9
MGKSDEMDSASKMLANALQQMDGIINQQQTSTLGSSRSNGSPDMYGMTTDYTQNHSIIAAAQNLAFLLQQQQSSSPTGAISNAFPDSGTMETISHWLDNQLPRPDSDERYRRLQSDKEALALQVQVLSEQVQLQNEKIVEMERLINEKNRLISNAEDLLQREILSRSSLETQKLELMTAMSELKLHNTALNHENQELREKCFGPALASKARQQIFQNNSLENSPIHRSHGSLAQSVLSTPKTPPATYRQKVQLTYNSLPRQMVSNCIENNVEKERKNVAFADADKYIESNNGERRSRTPTQSPINASKESKGVKGGLKSIFGKMKRSGSGNLEDLSPPNGDDFKRGGVRATAGPRLGYNFAVKKSDKAFKDYDTEDICAWLEELGLEVYIDDAKRWLKQGASELIAAGPEKIEKELNLKSPLHKKKLVLALADVTNQETDELFKNAGKLDLHWVLRWLEDIGLPQYKDTFTAAKMDGRMLHRLSMDDLTHLHISSCLHVASLRRGIQLMRLNAWNDEVLIRRSGTDSDDRDKVQLWTAHRVWDWLRVVDLAEYAPNLRGAGVHGALMMYEPKFTSELLADLLSIPPSKTLLRRHLSTHFKELLGRDVIQIKRDAENTLGYQPLTLYSKIKKKSQFSLIRKRSFKGSINETDTSELVCPMTDSSDDDISQAREKELSKDKSSRMKMTGCLSPQ